MTDTTSLETGVVHTNSASAKSASEGGLASLTLKQLKGLATQLGITGSSQMRKGDLVAVITAHQRGSSVTDRPDESAEPTVAAAPPSSARNRRPRRVSTQPETTAQEALAYTNPAGAPSTDAAAASPEVQAPGGANSESSSDTDGRRQRERPRRMRTVAAEPAVPISPPIESGTGVGTAENGQTQSTEERSRFERRRSREAETNNGRNNNNRRNRNERRRRPEDEVNDEDVLLPIAGILDILENYAFVRTSGYLPGPNDVYVSLSFVKKYNLRKGDAVVGAVKARRENEESRQRQKFNPLVQITSVNGKNPEEFVDRVDFSKLVPLYPQERLRLETDPKKIGPRVIDLVSPIGKGQRGLIVSPPKAGKTLILQAIANAITVNNPEVHLMMVLVDERPEEVTDMQRTVKGEVIASTFDRPADDHTQVAELSIERAKRLVEMGMDVVVLLDSMTRLGRAYNNAAPSSGRILSGGVDAAALYPPKRFFGAARNIEGGGSLTILATALVETGSKADEVIFEEFKGTGNMELRLARQLADKRIFPAVDVNASGTRREENLLSPEEIRIMWKMRRVLSALDIQQSAELLISKLRDTQSNAEFLLQVQKTALGPGGSDNDN